MKQMLQMFFMQMQHLHKMFFYFLGASLLICLLGMGVSAIGGLFLALIAMALVSAGTLAGGVGLTISLRSLFGLTQVGRLVQYGSFWLSAVVSLWVIDWIFHDSLMVHSAILAGFAIFAVAFTTATITGEVPTKGRSWLPVKMKAPPSA